MSTKRKRPFINDNGELEVFWHQLPPAPNEVALTAIAGALGMEESIFDFLGEQGRQADKTYWASFAEAVASCYMPTNGSSIAVPSPNAVRELHQAANDDENPTRFLQDFAIEALVLRKLPEAEDLQTPDELFQFALDRFAPFEEFGEVYDINSVQLAIRGLDVATDRQVDNAGESIRTTLT